MIHYRKISDGNGAAWLSTATLRELIWSDRYEVKPVDAGTLHEFPFILAVGETVTLLVWDKPGKLQDSRTVVQTLTRVERSTGNENSYTRSSNGGVHSWSEWERYPDVNELNEMSNGLGTAVEWGAGMRIDTFVNPGTYNITGERTSFDDGLPIVNAAPGHTVHARLVVLDSSIKGTGKSDDKCITQVLTLSNRTGGDGDVYIRTGSSHSKNMLAGGIGWEPWAKQQTIIEVGTTGLGSDKDLSSFIDNGMYSGVYVNVGAAGNVCYETFVMVVINNYAVAGMTGNTRCISQFKYALGTDGTFSYKTRTGEGDESISWGEWVDLGAAQTNDIKDGAITAMKLSSDVREKVENPLRPLYIAAGAEYNDTATDIEKTAPWGEAVTHKAGHYYLNGLGDITEEQMDFIFVQTYPFYSATDFTKAFRIQIDTDIPARTNLRNRNQFTGIGNNGVLALESVCYGNSIIEVLMINHTKTAVKIVVSGFENSFYNTSSLRYIVGVLSLEKCSTIEFKNCRALVGFNFYNLKSNIKMSQSVKVSKESIVYLIENASPTTAITITLHPEAYARLADDADIVATLEEQPLVSLVSA